MASVKVKFRASGVDGVAGRIYYRIIHGRMARQISTDFRIFPDEWDGRRGILVDGCGRRRCGEIDAVGRGIVRDMERIWRVIRGLENRGAVYTAAEVCDGFRRLGHDLWLGNMVEKEIERLTRNGKLTTAAHRRSMLRSVKRFLGSRAEKREDICLDELSGEWVMEYEAWLQGRGVTRNTSSFYLRTLRAVYNKGVEDGIVESRDLFRKAYTGVDKTVKRAIPIEAMRRIKGADLQGDRHLDYARDMFLLSFYFRGMSFVDMAYLKKADLVNGVVVYRRRKTGQKLMIKWRPEMQAIVNKYAENESEYLLPIIRKRGINERNAYRRASSNVNRYLKGVATKVGLTANLTHYVARHSWASAAQSKNVPIKVISEGMGHDSERTTRIYLASLDTSAVDRANDEILDSL